jgi:hypothetical protein
MFVRRRPLMRAAVVGGGAYIAGKRRGERSDIENPQQGGQDTGASDVNSGQSPPASTAGEPSMSDQLAQLSQLHQQGALSDAEFGAAKAKLLGN